MKRPASRSARLSSDLRSVIVALRKLGINRSIRIRASDQLASIIPDKAELAHVLRRVFRNLTGARAPSGVDLINLETVAAFVAAIAQQRRLREAGVRAPRQPVTRVKVKATPKRDMLRKRLVTNLDFYAPPSLAYLGVVAAFASPPVRPERQPRYANVALYSADGSRRLEQDRPLEAGEIVRLTLDIGERSLESQVREVAAFPDEMLENVNIDVMVSSTDFGVSRRRDAVRADGPRVAHGAFYLTTETSAARPVDGRDGKYIDFYLAIPRRQAIATARARIGYYYRNILLQSQLLKAQFGEEPGFTVETDFTTSDDLTGLSTFPERQRISVLTNANDDGTHQIVLRRPETRSGAEIVAETVTIDGNKIGNTIKNLRKKLDWLAPEYPRRDKSALIRDLKELAPIGWELYTQLPAKVPVEFFGAWRATPNEFVIQIARPTTSSFTAPWNYIYDIPILSQNYILCPLLDKWDGEAPLFSDTPRVCPHGPHGEDVLCPFGFWGYRYTIEQLAKRKDTKGIYKIEASAGCDIVAAQAQYEIKLDDLAKHIDRLRSMTNKALLKANLKEAKTKSEIRRCLGNDLPFVYFYCHGEYPGFGDPETFLGVGDHEKFRAADFIGWRDIWYMTGKVVWKAVKPLIFLNACHSVAIEPATLVSYVDAFVGSGNAAGVIGTEVKVAQALAMDAAEKFVDAWFRPKSKAEATVDGALRKMRLDYLRQGNLFGLAYTPYCWSELELVVN